MSKKAKDKVVPTSTEPMRGKEFERKLKPLHEELVNLRLWAQHAGYRAVIIFEGRDAAGKGGAIKAITERVSLRVFRVFAATDMEHAPWWVINADDPRRASLNCIAHLLSKIPYQELPRDKIKLSDRQPAGGYVEPRWRRHVVPEVY
jgi:polyphosphate kinase 2 (PPK2 family)